MKDERAAGDGCELAPAGVQDKDDAVADQQRRSAEEEHDIKDGGIVRDRGVTRIDENRSQGDREDRRHMVV